MISFFPNLSKSLQLAVWFSLIQLMNVACSPNDSPSSLSESSHGHKNPDFHCEDLSINDCYPHDSCMVVLNSSEKDSKEICTPIKGADLEGLALGFDRDRGDGIQKNKLKPDIKALLRAKSIEELESDLHKPKLLNIEPIINAILLHKKSASDSLDEKRHSSDALPSDDGQHEGDVLTSSDGMHDGDDLSSGDDEENEPTNLKNIFGLWSQTKSAGDKIKMPPLEEDSMSYYQESEATDSSEEESNEGIVNQAKTWACAQASMCKERYFDTASFAWAKTKQVSSAARLEFDNLLEKVSETLSYDESEASKDYLFGPPPKDENNGPWLLNFDFAESRRKHSKKQ